MVDGKLNEKIELHGRGYELVKWAPAKVPLNAMKFKHPPAQWGIQEGIIHITDNESKTPLRTKTWRTQK